jgi:Tol biopolymer transport system component
VFQSTRSGHTGLWAIPERRTLFGKRASIPVPLSWGLIELYAPAISNDGKHVFAVGKRRIGELVRYVSDLHEFVRFLGGISATWVTFSKSGRDVAYTVYPDATLWRAKSDGSEKKQITFAPLEVDGFSWSPDEKWFAIRARSPGNTWRIYLLPSAGGEPVPLMPGENEQGIPTWSADSARICFGDVLSVFGKAEGKQVIHVFDRRDGRLSDLPGSQGFWTSRWSPDGRYLSALTIESQRLMLFDFNANAWRSTGAKDVNNPNWSNDSKYIYYDTELSDKSLRRVRVIDGKVEELASLREFPNLGWWWSGITPDNSPLLLRNLGAPEIYSLELKYH